MIEGLKNIFNIPELRNRVLFTFSMLAVYQIGGQIPTPGSMENLTTGALRHRQAAAVSQRDRRASEP